MANASLKGKKVVVVGGSSGIGYAIAEAALAEGAKVVIASSKAENVTAAAARLGGDAEGRPLDVRDSAAVAGFFAGLGAFDHLAYTAGDWAEGRRFASQLELEPEAGMALMQVRFWSAKTAAIHASRNLASGGSITFTSGMLGHRPMKGAPLTAAFVGALEHLTMGLAMELAPVRVNCVCLGLIRTPPVMQMSEEMVRGWTARLPLARAGEPDEAAQAYIYCMRAGYTTGQTLRVDGGGSLV
ncbi:MAG TPA: SDR family oxidoreductase [Caulobacteraceae bacterium]|jgi:NAD(P)-dependent dehydrogenase (short-subunit alcohol dehydrogenase family)